VGCALLLLDNAVPVGLQLPSVNVDRVFGANLVARAERYERFLLVDWVLAHVALLVVLSVYARRGAGLARESAAGRIGTGMLLGMLGLGIVWLVQLPFGLAAVWWGRRYGTTETGYLQWVFGGWLELGATFLSISFALAVVMALAGWLGESWWLPGAAVFVGVAALFLFVSPWLQTTRKLDDASLVAAARSYEREQGLPEIPLRVEDVSGTTSQANAYATGIGPSRVVVLWDTLLDGRFSKGAERFVVAHELAHHSSRHLVKALAWFALFAIPGAWLVMRITRRRGGIGVPDAVPLALLVVAVYQLALSPAQAWISRGMEAEADWKALQSTRDPSGARRLFVGFSHTGLGNPDPPTWAYLLLDSHPTLAQRVAMADAWRRSSAP
jgi:Zn-dependent protease with chaperone function